MKATNLKNIILIIIEVLFIFATGVILNILNFVSWVNIIIYILLTIEILWTVKISYDKYDLNSNNACVLSFVMAAVIYILFGIIAKFIQIPNTYLASYSFIMGYLTFNGCFIIYKHNKHLKKYKLWPSVVKIIGIFIFIMSALMGILCLFGLARHR